ncbi:MAG: DUF4010 domain-containing protein [Pseudomonadota bacterium]|nr:DUF4010 domain-containing protein [Pseudomonadota bacterium]
MAEAFLAAMAPFQGVMLALALGFLIGIERGWSRREAPDGARVAGIRTFALLGLTGGIAGEAGRQFSLVPASVILAAAAATLLAGYALGVRRQESVSATTTVAGIITLGLGFFAAMGQGVLASVLAAIMMLVLASRHQLHGWLVHLNQIEIRAIARFAVISLAVLPLLPDQAYGPYDAWNPHKLWLMVVLVSGISFAGYVAAKRFGSTRGILVTAIAGAVVSSTAVTASLAMRLRQGDGIQKVLTAGIAAASAVMFLRVLVLVAILAPFALASTALLIGPAALFSTGFAGWLFSRTGGKEEKGADVISLRNPFDIRSAVILAGLVMVLSVIARWTLDHVGDAGLAAALAVSGMADVDSAVITIGTLPRGSLDAKIAGLILAACVMINTLVKAGILVGIAGWSAGWKAALPLVLSVAAGLLVLPVLLVQG